MSNSKAVIGESFVVVYGNVMIKRLPRWRYSMEKCYGIALSLHHILQIIAIVPIERANSMAFFIDGDGNVARTFPIAERAIGH